MTVADVGNDTVDTKKVQLQQIEQSSIKAKLLNVFGWFSSTVGAITLFSSIVGLIELAPSAKWLVDHWNNIIHFVWKNVLFFLPHISSFDANFLTIFFSFISVIMISSLASKRHSTKKIDYLYFVLISGIFIIVCLNGILNSYSRSTTTITYSIGLTESRTVWEHPGYIWEIFDHLNHEIFGYSRRITTYHKGYELTNKEFNQFSSPNIEKISKTEVTVLVVFETVILSFVIGMFTIFCSFLFLRLFASRNINFHQASKRLFTVLSFALCIVALNYIAIGVEYTKRQIEQGVEGKAPSQVQGTVQQKKVGE